MGYVLENLYLLITDFKNIFDIFIRQIRVVHKNNQLKRLFFLPSWPARTHHLCCLSCGTCPSTPGTCPARWWVWCRCRWRSVPPWSPTARWAATRRTAGTTGRIPLDTVRCRPATATGQCLLRSRSRWKENGESQIYHILENKFKWWFVNIVVVVIKLKQYTLFISIYLISWIVYLCWWKKC